MIPRIGLQRVVCRNANVRASYAEISQFIRTRHHGTTSFNSRLGIRCLSSSIARKQIEPTDAARKALDSYKATIFPDYQAFTPWNSLTPENVDKEVSIVGYLGTRRDVSKKMTFALLRDPGQAHCIQLISMRQKTPPVEGAGPDSHTTLKSVKDWTPVVITGFLRTRNQPSKESTAMGIPLINNTEIEVQSVKVLNEIPSDLLLKDDTVFSPEQRHLAFRTGAEMRKNIQFRFEAMKTARKILDGLKVTEIETPILFKSTPEGAREFLVPTRTKGLAYALPQSPQQYKQILMASGFLNYYQFARCFRDEDLRADRQPEFTQLDIEMAWRGESDVQKVIEELLHNLWKTHLSQEITTPFQRMTYQTAMSTYGSDKPDLRLGMQIQSITAKLPSALIGTLSGLESPIVDAFRMPGFSDPKAMKKFIAGFLDSPEGKPFLDNTAGQPGIFVCDEAAPMQGLGTLGYDWLMDQPDGLALSHGDLLILQARPNEALSGGSTPLGNLRLALHKAAVAQDLIDKAEGFAFVWIVDFPLLSPTTDADPGQGGTAGFSSTHHPFTAPKTAADVDLLLTAPEKAIAAHYDIVVNGVELGGGSRRIHNALVQEFILRDVLCMKSERVEDFRHLLDVLGSGCPPHAGIALGWDRLMAVMLGRESVRDVIAFPKSGRGEDGLVKSPNRVLEGQWGVYHLRVVE